MTPVRIPRFPALALGGLLVLAVLYTLYFARLLLLPVLVAVLLSVLLEPLVRGLGRLRIPNSLGAGLVVLALAAGLAGAVWLLAEPAGEWMDRAPSSFAEAELKLHHLKEPMERMSRATEGMEKLGELDDGGDRGHAPVQVEGKSLLRHLFTNAVTLGLGLLVVLVLLYFLLASGDTFLRKLVGVLPTLEDKKRAVEVTRRLQRDFSRYLGLITLINLGLGGAVGVAMYLLGMPNPTLWGALAAGLNFVPYVGALAGVAVIGLASAVTFNDPGVILLPPLVYFALTTTEGYLLTPVLLGRRLTLNPVMILLSILLWGWLWGVAGALLAVPLLAALKIVCDGVGPLNAVGEFLGR